MTNTASSVDDDRAFWDRYAQFDPLWAILSDPSKAGRRWGVDEFLETGRREISLLMYQLRALGLEVPRTAALDFGCGVGRLTLPLAAHFDRVVGVDVSPGMVRLAEALNPTPDRVRYVCNAREDLSVLDGQMFPFIYSNVVLQHVAPPRAEGYLKELLRVLAPGGLLVFQLPSHLRPADEPPAVRLRMPDDAYRASMKIESALPESVAAGTTFDVTVSVTNVSETAWVQAQVGSIRVGNHWLDAAGRMLVQDDGRATLPGRLEPGQTSVVAISVTAPHEPGAYQLECDVVHEGISWFSDKGSPTCRATVAVAGGPPSDVDSSGAATEVGVAGVPLALPELASVEAPGALPMYGIPRGDVITLIEQHEAAVVHIESDERCGPEWVGFRYVVRGERRRP